MLNKGMSSIPNELLARIFELAYEADGPRQRNVGPITLSHVCRHFRAVALDTPRLWSVVSNWMCIEEMEASISRSKAVELVVLFDQNVEESLPPPLRPRLTLKEVMEAVVPHQKRWIKFDLKADVSGLMDQENVNILALYPDLELPSLQGMVLKFATIVNHPESISDRVASCISGWLLPSFVKIEMHNILPSSLLVPRDLLTDCHLSFEISREEPLNTNSIIAALSGLDNLELLFLCFGGDVTTGEGFTGDDRPVVMPKLTAMMMTIVSDQQGPATVPPSAFLRSLRMPKLETLRFTLYTGTNTEDWLAELPIHSKPVDGQETEKDSCHLTELDVVMLHTSANAQVLFDSCNNLPHLRNLKIINKQLSFESFISLSPLPALHSLSLTHCDSLQENFPSILRDWCGTFSE